MASHSSILAWKIPWTEEPGGRRPRGHKESDVAEHTHTALGSSCRFCGGFLTRSSPVTEILPVFLQASTSFVSPVL